LSFEIPPEELKKTPIFQLRDFPAIKGERSSLLRATASRFTLESNLLWDFAISGGCRRMIRGRARGAGLKSTKQGRAAGSTHGGLSPKPKAFFPGDGFSNRSLK